MTGSRTPISYQRANLGRLGCPDADRAAPAIVEAAGPHAGKAVSHATLDARADAVARGLTARGLAGDGGAAAPRIALLAANSADYLACYLGVMRAGAVSIPISYKLPPATLATILDDCAARLVFVDHERRGLVPAGLPLVEIDGAEADSLDCLVDPGPFETVCPVSGGIAMVLYTSGTAGRPKGVPLTHEGQIWSVERRLGLLGDVSHHRLLIAAPLYHMNGLFLAKLAIAGGARIVLLPQFSASEYIRAIDRHRTTWLTSVPTMLALVAREEALLAEADVASVEVVGMGSAPVSPALLDRLRRIFAGARIMINYGTTETGAVIFGPHPEGVPKPDSALGYPLPDVSVRLIGPDGAPADEGVAHILTPANTPGYLNLPEAWARSLDESGHYVTGDIMRRDADGFFHFVGRADDMFVCGGENIYPAEVERMLEAHGDIDQACVVPVPDEIKGDKPVAFMVPRPGSALTEAAVKAHALAHAPAFQHPRRVFFVDALPLAGTNKIDRAALRARAVDLVGERASA